MSDDGEKRIIELLEKVSQQLSAIHEVLEWGPTPKQGIGPNGEIFTRGRGGAGGISSPAKAE